MVKHPKSRAIYTRNIVLIIIILAVLAVISALVAVFLLNPEHQVKQKVESLASNYYENIFYEKMLSSDQFSGDPSKALEPHSTNGLSIITLRQLLLQNQNATDIADYLTKYCDENATTIRFYPEAPYSRTDYHTEYTYSCNF